MSGFYVKVNPNAVDYVIANSDKPTIFNNGEGGEITVTSIEDSIVESAITAKQFEENALGNITRDIETDVLGNIINIGRNPAPGAIVNDSKKAASVAETALASSVKLAPETESKQNNRLKSAVHDVMTLNKFKQKTNVEKETELTSKFDNMNDDEKTQIGQIVSTKGYKELHNKINKSTENIDDIDDKKFHEIEESIKKELKTNSNHTNVSDQVIKFLIFCIFAPITFPAAVLGGKKSRKRRKGKGKKGKSMKRRGTRGKKAKK